MMIVIGDDKINIDNSISNSHNKIVTLVIIIIITMTIMTAIIIVTTIITKN